MMFSSLLKSPSSEFVLARFSTAFFLAGRIALDLPSAFCFPLALRAFGGSNTDPSVVSELSNACLRSSGENQADNFRPFFP